MGVASRKRWRVVGLGLGLAVAGVVAGAAGLVAWRRARVPWRTLHVPPKTSVWFFVGDRALVTVRECEETGSLVPDFEEEVWSLSDGRLLHTKDGYSFSSWEPASGSRLKRGPGGSLELEDPVTESRRRLLDSGVASDRWPMAVSPTLDLVAFVSSAGVEVRSTLGAPTRPALVLPTRSSRASLVFSAGGDALAYVDYQGARTDSDAEPRASVWSLASPGSPRVFEGLFVGFTSRSEVVTLWPMPWNAGNGVGKVTVHRASGESRVVAETTSTFAASLLCERLATLDADEKAVLVSELETGALVRRIPVRPNVRNLRLSPEGDKLAVAFRDGLVEVWELPPS